MDTDVSKELYAFIFLKILNKKDSSKYLSEIAHNPQWHFKNRGSTIRFFSRSLLSNIHDYYDIPMSDFRKLLRGADRLSQKTFYISTKDKATAGVFPLREAKIIWQLKNKTKLDKIVLVPYPKNPKQANMLCFIFKTFCIGLKSIIQLFSTESYQQEKIEEQYRSAEAYYRFVELVPFTIDRIIDLLSTEPIAPSYDLWEKDPKTYDWPKVDTANLSKAKELTDSLPLEELELLIKTLRNSILNKDWEAEND
ncbi:MAG: hypothetical protein ACTSYN_05780, partial [Candidatus Heimdallarchaeaceae archaeon]